MPAASNTNAARARASGWEGASAGRLFVLAILPGAVVLLVAMGWGSVARQNAALVQTNVATYQQTQLALARAAARSIAHHLAVHGVETEAGALGEQTLVDQYIAPIALLDGSHAWAYSGGRALLNWPDPPEGCWLDADSATASPGHAPGEGVGWCLGPDGEQRVAAWAVAAAGDTAWVVGLSTPLSAILEATGSASQLRAQVRGMGLSTLAALCVLSAWLLIARQQRRAERELRASRAELEQRVHARTRDLAAVNETLEQEVAERMRVVERLRARDAVLSAVGYAARELLSADDLDAAIASVLARLGRAARASRAGIYAADADGDAERTAAQPLCDWADECEPSPAESSEPQSIDSAVPAHARWAQQFREGRPVFGQVDDLPEAERAALEARGTVSFAAVPILAGRRWWGWMLFEACGRPRSWAVGEIDALTAAAEMIGAAVERRCSEKALRRSEARYRAVVEGQTELVCRFTPEGILTFVNQAYCRCFGQTAEQLVGRAWAPLVPEEDQAHVAECFARLSPETPTVTYEHRVITPEGIRWQQWTDHAIIGEGGDIVEIQAVGRDVTPRVLAEQALRESEQNLATLFDSLDDMLFVCDLQGAVLRVNSSLRERLGYTSEELRAMRVPDLHPADRREEAEAALAMLRVGEIDTYAIPMCSKEGRVIPVETKVTRGRWGERPVLIAVSRDVSERQRLEEELRRAHKVEAIGRLAAGVAHDFNNVLTIINGYGQFMLGALDEEDALRGYVLQVLKAGQRASDMTRQLLAFSRQQALEMRILCLNDSIRGLAKILPRLIGEDVALDVNLAPDLWPVRADPGQLGQVLVNLAANARDAMPEGGRLSIETRNCVVDRAMAQRYPGLEAGEYVLLRVADTGMGMDVEVRERLFEPFFTTKEVGQGTGLGLPTVHGIVKQCGGEVLVESEPGRGTVLDLYFPRAQFEPEEARSREEEAGLPRGEETILVVEDQDEVRSFMCSALRRLGYETLEAGNGLEGIALYEERGGRVDLVLTDVVMPLMNGSAMVAKLLEQRANLPVVYASGYTDEAIVRYGVLDSGLPLLQKPFTVAALAMTVREALDKGHPQRRRNGRIR